VANVNSTIDSLKRFNQLQGEVIGHLEAYERAVSGWNSAEVRLSGYRNGYASELGYLRERRVKLNVAIASMEKYALNAHHLADVG
jgi:hypothetical protein